MEFGTHWRPAVFAPRTTPGIAMEQLDPLRAEHPSRRVTESRRWASSMVLPAIAAVLLLIVVLAKLRGEELPTMLMVAVATGFVAVMLLGTRFLIRALREHRESEARFQQMASNIREIFWMIGRNPAPSVRKRSLRDHHRAIMSVAIRQSNFLRGTHSLGRSHPRAGEA